jgi:transcriptional regulator with XRE-family HTH domain
VTITPDQPTFAGRLRAKRRSKGMTLAQLAELSGLSLPYISNLERGHGNPTVAAITKLAVGLDAPVSELIGDSELTRGGETQEALLAEMPRSLATYSRTAEFDRAITRLAEEEGADKGELRRRVLAGMAAAPRRGNGEPTVEDWRRLMDVYTTILRQ